VTQEFKTESLRRAIAQLEEAYSFASEELKLLDSRYRVHLRTAAIKSFEYTYESCHKMLRRSLQNSEPSEMNVDQLSFSDLFRLGYKRGLVNGDLRVWSAFRAARNRTSHTYDEEDAQAVFEAIPEFLNEARFLLKSLNQASR
jgi:nucleotidyltransferase substrate binding protein (TIGR01987 family)